MQHKQIKLQLLQRVNIQQSVEDDLCPYLLPVSTTFYPRPQPRHPPSHFLFSHLCHSRPSATPTQLRPTTTAAHHGVVD